MRRKQFGHGFNSTDDEPGEDYALLFEAETDLAWGVREGYAFDEPTVWLPKSACSISSSHSLKPGDAVSLWVPNWLAIEKGLV